MRDSHASALIGRYSTGEHFSCFPGMHNANCVIAVRSAPFRSLAYSAVAGDRLCLAIGTRPKLAIFNAPVGFIDIRSCRWLINAFDIDVALRTYVGLYCSEV